MGNALIAAQLDAEIARLHSGQQNLSDVSLRELSRLSGVKLTRLGDALSAAAPPLQARLSESPKRSGLKGGRCILQHKQVAHMPRPMSPSLSPDPQRLAQTQHRPSATRALTYKSYPRAARGLLSSTGAGLDL